MGDGPLIYAGVLLLGGTSCCRLIQGLSAQRSGVPVASGTRSVIVRNFASGVELNIESPAKRANLPVALLEAKQSASKQSKKSTSTQDQLSLFSFMGGAFAEHHLKKCAQVSFEY